MPNFAVHALAWPVPIIAGTLVAAPEDGGQLVVTAGTSLAVGKVGVHLPDWLEPSLFNPRHRKFFHSWTFLAILAAGSVWVVKKLWNKAEEFRERARISENPEVVEESKFGAVVLTLLAGAVAALAIGYAIHLLMDSTTKRGLPYI